MDHPHGRSPDSVDNLANLWVLWMAVVIVCFLVFICPLHRRKRGRRCFLRDAVAITVISGKTSKFMGKLRLGYGKTLRELHGSPGPDFVDNHRDLWVFGDRPTEDRRWLIDYI